MQDIRGRMKKIALAAALLGSAVSAPAVAQTYSLVNDFGNAVFQYGTVNTATNVFTPFAQSNCNDIGVSGLCYRGSDTYQVEFQRDAGNLLIHPGPNDGQNTFLMFVAPHAGNYTFNTTFNRGDSGDGVGIFTYNNQQGGLNAVGTLDAANPTFSYNGTQFLNAGQIVGLGVDRGGTNNTYFNDSTFLSGSIAGVPEPATWALMILGFGATGAAMRRRSAVRTSIRYA